MRADTATSSSRRVVFFWNVDGAVGHNGVNQTEDEVCHRQGAAGVPRFKPPVHPESAQPGCGLCSFSRRGASSDFGGTMRIECARADALL